MVQVRVVRKARIRVERRCAGRGVRGPSGWRLCEGDFRKKRWRAVHGSRRASRWRAVVRIRDDCSSRNRVLSSGGVGRGRQHRWSGSAGDVDGGRDGEKSSRWEDIRLIRNGVGTPALRPEDGVTRQSLHISRSSIASVEDILRFGIGFKRFQFSIRELLEPRAAGSNACMRLHLECTSCRCHNARSTWQPHRFIMA